MTSGNEYREVRNHGVMATFSFQLRTGDGLDDFKIISGGTKKVPQKGEEECVKKRIGCGKSINWSEMNTVPVPPEFRDGSVNTSDIDVVHPNAGGVKGKVGSIIKEGKKMFGFGSMN